MSFSNVYFSLGSNVGERLHYLMQAAVRLSSFLSHPEISRVYETEPQEVTAQPRFLNLVLSGQCDLTPQELLVRCQATEAELGRERAREVKKGPRPIDIDILLYGELTSRSADLTLPHPAMKQRQFVLVPLLEISPELVEPGTGTPYVHYLSLLSDQGIYYYGGTPYNGGNPEHQ